MPHSQAKPAAGNDTFMDLKIMVFKNKHGRILIRIASPVINLPLFYPNLMEISGLVLILRNWLPKSGE